MIGGMNTINIRQEINLAYHCYLENHYKNDVYILGNNISKTQDLIE